MLPVRQGWTLFAECPKVNNHDKHKFKDKRNKSKKKKEHGHGKKTRSREKMKRSSGIESDSEDTSSSSSDEDEEDDKKKKKNLDKYLNGLCVTGLSLKDDFCGKAHSSSSKRSQKDASDFDFEDEVCDELSSLRKENEELVDLLDNRDHMLREAKKLRMELRALREDARTRVAELETQVIDGKLEIDSLKASPVVSDEVDCADCSAFLADLTALREIMPPSVRNYMCLGLRWLSCHLDPLCLVHVLLALICMKKLLTFDLVLFHLRLI
jgi:hypothetical protein